MIALPGALVAAFCALPQHSLAPWHTAPRASQGSSLPPAPLSSKHAAQLSCSRGCESGELQGASREMAAVILPGEEFQALGLRSSLLFTDKSEKRALKQAMKGGLQGKDGKVARLALVQFDEVLLASRRMQLAPQGVEVQVISREKLVEAVGGGEVGAGEEASRSIKVEVQQVGMLHVEQKPVQLEPFVRVRVRGLANSGCNTPATRLK